MRNGRGVGWTFVPLMERITLPREPATPRRARHYLAPRLAHLGMDPQAAGELLVAVGEAVTNAVLYGGGTSGVPDADTVLVELIVRRDCVAVAVSSPSARWHVPEAKLPADPLASRGRGLYVMR